MWCHAPSGGGCRHRYGVIHTVQEADEGRAPRVARYTVVSDTGKATCMYADDNNRVRYALSFWGEARRDGMSARACSTWNAATQSRPRGQRMIGNRKVLLRCRPGAVTLSC